jgi:2-C-methyl-D-erythritol 4-phosphate cytidylyltransferase
MSPSLSAVVVAAGRARRFQESSGIKTNKVLLSFEGAPVIRRTLNALFALPLKTLALVIRTEEKAAFREAIQGLDYESRVIFVAGGERRQDSVRAGLEALPMTDFVLIHDGARPFVDKSFLEALWNRAQHCEALIPIQAISETLKEINSEGAVVRTWSRDRFVRAQTPQFFKLKVLRTVHEALRDSAEEFTDDSAMVERMGHRVETTAGLAANVKITTQDDLLGAKLVG